MKYSEIVKLSAAASLCSPGSEFLATRLFSRLGPASSLPFLSARFLSGADQAGGVPWGPWGHHCPVALPGRPLPPSPRSLCSRSVLLLRSLWQPRFQLSPLPVGRSLQAEAPAWRPKQTLWDSIVPLLIVHFSQLRALDAFRAQSVGSPRSQVDTHSVCAGSTQPPAPELSVRGAPKDLRKLGAPSHTVTLVSELFPS